MSFMEILEMFHKLPKKDGNSGALMTGEQYEASKQSWKDMNLDDVRIN